jgi:Domain of unknown function (DUF4139)/N-terminal domain of unknown function (DUF4140)
MSGPVNVESRIEAVVVYARGAVVTRVAPLPSTLGDAEIAVVVSGLPPAIEPGSLRASLDTSDAPAARDVVALDAAWTVPEAVAQPQLGEVLVRLRALAHDLVAIVDEQRALETRRAALGAALEPGLARGARREVRRRGPPFDVQARVADALAIDALQRRKTAEIDERLRALAERHAEVLRRFQATRLEATQAPRGKLDGGARPTWAVTVRLSRARSARPVAELRIEYVVRAARWWPAHSARFTDAGTRVAWTREALVAQDSGEDWSGVRLALSTGDLIRDARLPVLKSLRIGRAQAAAPRAYRPPPSGLDALFSGFDRVAAEIQASPFPPAALRRPTPGPTLAAIDALVQGSLLSDGARAAKGMSGGAPRRATSPPSMMGSAVVKSELAPAVPPPAPSPAAPAAFGGPPVAAVAPQAFRGPPRGGHPMSPMQRPRGEVAAAEPEELAEDEPLSITAEPAVEVADEWLELHLLVIAASVERYKRGRLAHAEASPGERAAREREQAIAALPSPPKAKEPGELGAVFDYRLDATHPLDVPSDAKVHRLAVDTHHAAATTTFRVVPREAPEVYRESSFASAPRGPLLPGPVEVFVDGALLSASSLDQARDAGGFVTLGLGVEERLRVARNVQVYESTAGLLGGSAQVDHAIVIDVRSALGHPARVEVVDRLPVTDEKEVTVKVLSAQPERESYDQATRGAPIRGGLVWSLPVPAGGEAKIEWAYRVVFPAKSEIVGGNRRE